MGALFSEQSIRTRCAQETFQLGFTCASQLRVGACLALVGELGAGKTTFVQGLAQGLGVRDPVSSPSYLIVQEYAGPIPLFHVDCYRLRGAQELADIGFDEYLHGGGVVVVEWADKAPQALPASAQWIYFTIDPDGTRQIRLSGAAAPGT